MFATRIRTYSFPPCRSVPREKVNVPPPPGAIACTPFSAMFSSNCVSRSGSPITLGRSTAPSVATTVSTPSLRAWVDTSDTTRSINDFGSTGLRSAGIGRAKERNRSAVWPSRSISSMCSSSIRRSGTPSGTASRRISAVPFRAWSGFLISWAIPAVISPSAPSFPARISCASILRCSARASPSRVASRSCRSRSRRSRSTSRPATTATILYRMISRPFSRASAGSCTTRLVKACGR